MKQITESVLHWIKFMGLSHLREEHERYSHIVKGDYDSIQEIDWEEFDDILAMLREIQERIITRKYKWELIPLEQIQAVVDAKLQ